MPSNLSGLLNNFSILMAALFFSFARYFRRYLLIAIMLVSEPEKKADKIKNNPFLKDEEIIVDDNIANDDVSSSCLICHK